MATIPNSAWLDSYLGTYSSTSSSSSSSPPHLRSNLHSTQPPLFSLDASIPQVAVVSPGRFGASGAVSGRQCKERLADVRVHSLLRVPLHKIPEPLRTGLREEAEPRDRTGQIEIVWLRHGRIRVLSPVEAVFRTKVAIVRAALDQMYLRVRIDDGQREISLVYMLLLDAVAIGSEEGNSDNVADEYAAHYHRPEFGANRACLHGPSKGVRVVEHGRPINARRHPRGADNLAVPVGAGVSPRGILISPWTRIEPSDSLHATLGLQHASLTILDHHFRPLGPLLLDLFHSLGTRLLGAVPGAYP
jgi:hypothetical protein